MNETKMLFYKYSGIIIFINNYGKKFFYNILKKNDFFFI